MGDVIRSLVYHTFDAYYNDDSQILILGSMPSVKSRELNFYYMHPKNRFWKVLEAVFNVKIGSTIDEKKEFLKKYKIALWDVIESCEITGSSDASIRNIKYNDISSIINKTNIKRIYTTGQKAFELYNKYCYNETKIEATKLFSTSPANCKITFDVLVENYKVINKNFKYI